MNEVDIWFTFHFKKHKKFKLFFKICKSEDIITPKTYFHLNKIKTKEK